MFKFMFKSNTTEQTQFFLSIKKEIAKKNFYLLSDEESITLKVNEFNGQSKFDVKVQIANNSNYQEEAWIEVNQAEALYVSHLITSELRQLIKEALKQENSERSKRSQSYKERIIKESLKNSDS